MSQYTKVYQDFFRDSQAGTEFVDGVRLKIRSAYDMAATTTDPDECFAHVQRAKGIKDVLTYITTITTEPKKGKTAD